MDYIENKEDTGGNIVFILLSILITAFHYKTTQMFLYIKFTIFPINIFRVMFYR